MRYAVLLVAGLAAGPALADCPAVPDMSAQVDPLMEELRESENDAAARAVMNELWKIWTSAPDERAQGYLDQGMRLRAEYDLLGAWEAFNMLIAYCPDYAEGYNQRAYVAFLREDYASAIEDVEKALERNPVHVGALAGKAVSQIELDGPEAGQEALREALKLDPWLPERRYLIEPEGTDI